MRLPLLAGLARRRSGEPWPNTCVWPITSSKVRGRMRTANGRVIDSGASAAPNKSFSLITSYSTPVFEQTFELHPGFPQRGEPRKESVTHLVVVEDYFAGVLGGVEVHDAFDGPVVVAIGIIDNLTHLPRMLVVLVLVIQHEQFGRARFGADATYSCSS